MIAPIYTQSWFSPNSCSLSFRNCCIFGKITKTNIKQRIKGVFIVTTKKKLLLIDGHSVAFRAFYALHSQLESMTNSNGLHTNALYGFHGMLEKVMDKEQPKHARIAFEAGSPTFSHAFLDNYQAGREPMPDYLQGPTH